ncbi:MAG: hypothetical protein ACI8W8_004385 [Rhodothermales bacterium]|jgi:hypothetical protein
MKTSLFLALLLNLAAAAGPPEIWFAPPDATTGESLRQLFAHPEQWPEARSRIQVLQYADHRLDRQFSDDELRAWLPMLEKWGLKLALEVGAVKPWGQTGQQTFAIQRQKWDRFQALGGKIHAIALDEPLVCCRAHIKKPDAYALQETANFIALVRQHYPEILIGEIESYPFIPIADHLWWIDALQSKLAEMKVRGLDFYRLDVNWVNFLVQSEGNWRGVREIERACRQRKLPFSLIYWPSDLPLLARKGVADESTLYLSIMHQRNAYAMVDGRPDQYVIQSWLKSGNPPCLPETAPWSLTRTLLDFTTRMPKLDQ